MKILFILLSSALALGCNTTISGHITTPTGKAVYDPQGKVNISRLDKSGFVEIVNIDKNGHFESDEDIKPGEYLVEPLIPGFQSSSIKVQVKEDQVVKIQAIPFPKKRSRAIEAHNNIQVDQGSGGAIINPPRL